MLTLQCNNGAFKIFQVHILLLFEANYVKGVHRIPCKNCTDVSGIISIGVYVSGDFYLRPQIFDRIYTKTMPTAFDSLAEVTLQNFTGGRAGRVIEATAGPYNATGGDVYGIYVDGGQLSITSHPVSDNSNKNQIILIYFHTTANLFGGNGVAQGRILRPLYGLIIFLESSSNCTGGVAFSVFSGQMVYAGNAVNGSDCSTSGIISIFFEFEISPRFSLFFFFLDRNPPNVNFIAVETILVQQCGTYSHIRGAAFDFSQFDGNYSLNPCITIMSSYSLNLTVTNFTSPGTDSDDYNVQSFFSFKDSADITIQGFYLNQSGISFAGCYFVDVVDNYITKWGIDFQVFIYTIVIRFVNFL